MRIIMLIGAIFIVTIFAPSAFAQNDQTPTLAGDTFQTGAIFDLNKIKWKYRSGDDAAWAVKDFDDSGWDETDGANINLESPPPSGWNGRGWFRTRFRVDDSVAGRTMAIVIRQIGASEIYLDGQLIARVGEIRADGEDTEINPRSLPVPFKLERAGDHTLAVRYSLSSLKDPTSLWGRRAAGIGVKPGLTLSLKDASDLVTTILDYKQSGTMRTGFLFIGILSALALVHLLLFAFYRAERANLFYSIYAVAFAINLVCGNFLAFGHQGLTTSLILGRTANVMIATVFVSLLAFLHVAFGRQFDWRFWAISGLWAANVVSGLMLDNRLTLLRVIPFLAIFFTFTFGFYLLAKALRQRRPGAWILMIGVQLFALPMLLILFTQLFKLFDPPDFVNEINEIVFLLGVPISVSVFLAYNFARTNRNLAAQLANVERLSAQQIEQERQATELRAENERRTKELEEARQLQLSMLPKKLPELPNLEIAAYMRPATEVGGDYYDFHVSDDGTLTVAVGDATGHGLKAGTIVTATKGLFNNLAAAPNIPETLGQISRALKRMNLRGLFMAMTLLKIKDNAVSISTAGMPSTLIYRSATGAIEPVDLRALPLGGVTKVQYEEQKFAISAGDCIVLMSDGFPEMFNEAGEMLGDEPIKQLLRDSAGLSPSEIINRFAQAGAAWAGNRLPDDDVTFVVLKVKENGNFHLN